MAAMKRALEDEPSTPSPKRRRTDDTSAIPPNESISSAATHSERKEDDGIICKSVLSDSFLLYLIGERSEMPQNVKSYEHQFLSTNRRFKSTKLLAVELYLGFQRLIVRHKVKKWRNRSFDVSKRERHRTLKAAIAPTLYEVLTTLCGAKRVEIEGGDKGNGDEIERRERAENLYEDIGAIHREAALQNAKTRTSYLKELYVLGSNNVPFQSAATRRHFQSLQTASQRQGLSTNDDPFSAFSFSVDIELLIAQNRTECVYCGKRSHLYCPHCRVPFAIKMESGKWRPFPTVSLPVNVVIIRHPKETVNVCSSVHSCVLSPDNVKMYEFPSVPALSEEEGVYLLYPSESATFLDQMDLAAVSKIVVIESRWRGNTPIYDHPQLRALPRCKIRNRDTLYWRFQEKSREHLATIEAIYYGVLDCWRARNRGKPYRGQFDDLLLLFAQNHRKIKSRDKGHSKKFWKV